VPKIVIQAAARNGWDDVHQRISDEGKFDNSLFGMEIARPLTDAAECGHLSTFKLILKIQNGRSTPGSRKMLPCVAMEGNLQVLDLALREGASLDQQLYVPLIAAMKGHKEMLVHSLDHGFHLDHEDPEALQRYALCAAIAHRQCATAENLIRRLGVGPDSVMFQHEDITVTPLTMAIDFGSVELVQLIKRMGAIDRETGVTTTSYTRLHRKRRHEAIHDGDSAWGMKLKLRGAYARWDYHVHQREVDAALREVDASDGSY
jgi:hypothetical protein